MFMVGGGILGHSLPPLHHFAEGAAAALAGVPVAGRVLAAIAPTVIDALAGLATGALVLLGVKLVSRLAGRRG
jgi:predicted DNA repair protein MutK